MLGMKRKKRLTEEQKKLIEERKSKKTPTPHMIQKQALKELMTKFNQRDLKFTYFSLNLGSRYKKPGVITCASLLDREQNTVKVAFAFCDPRDIYDKTHGKVKALSRLTSTDPEDLKFVSTLPWLKDSLYTAALAFSNLPHVPSRFRNIKFDVIIQPIRLTKDGEFVAA